MCIRDRFDGVAMDGRLNEEQFTRAMGGDGAGSMLHSLVFSRFDRSNNGLISFEDFVSGLSPLASRAPHWEKIKYSFDLMDRTRSGFIARADLSRLVQESFAHQGLHFTQHQMDQIIGAAIGPRCRAPCGTPKEQICFTEWESLCACTGWQDHALRIFTMPDLDCLCEAHLASLVCL
eukprot:TRINITY_DN44706_c0_g1_i1.p1 TRINITY_DN44706_c0_g1~~TRINITY_DN44706_c0_g1_i1.p1  ORF type:complete len:177 (-),score=31.44 TRINITY_DN44706_c0_g1_i1:254-784(-)